MKAHIAAIEYYLPAEIVDNDRLADELPGFDAKKILMKTGIAARHIAAADECASDLGIAAARQLFETGACLVDEVDFLIFCTQAPDFLLPTTACIVHQALGLRHEAGALDINLGCSGFVYGLGLARGLIESAQARTILLITADTYSKFIDRTDASVRTIFGDGGAATLIRATRQDDTGIGHLLYGTDGSGAHNLIAGSTGLRDMPSERRSYEDHHGRRRDGPPLHMDGPEVFAFTLRAVPAAIDRLLNEAAVKKDAVDLFVFHQANAMMLESLRKKLAIPPERFFVSMEDCGNTVSATIPIALKRAALAGVLEAGMTVALVGFGVGYSWSAAIVTWSDFHNSRNRWDLGSRAVA